MVTEVMVTSREVSNTGAYHIHQESQLMWQLAFYSNVDSSVGVLHLYCLPLPARRICYKS